jgi:type IV pilus assembly protein PilP
VKRLGAVLLFGALAVAGCRNDATGPTTSDYQAAKPALLAKANAGRAAPAKAAAPAPAPAGPAQASVGHGFTYDATGKRDPFRSFILEQAKRKANEEIGPLEQFDISQLDVVAVVWDTAVPRALISDPSGRPYIVSHGSEVGKNDGKVIQIADDMVVVKETYVDWMGEKTTKDIEMRLKSGDKGGERR